MFINKAFRGRNNLGGKKIRKYREELDIFQRKLADRPQLTGMNVHKNAIQRIEDGKRFVTDIELSYLSMIPKRPYTDLIGIKLLPPEKEVKEGFYRVTFNFFAT